MLNKKFIRVWNLKFKQTFCRYLKNQNVLSLSGTGVEYKSCDKIFHPKLSRVGPGRHAQNETINKRKLFRRRNFHMHPCLDNNFHKKLFIR